MTHEEYRALREAIDAGPAEDRTRERAILEYEWYEERDPTDELCHRADILPYVPAIVAELRRLRTIEATAVQQVKMAAAAIKRAEAAERLAESVLSERRIRQYAEAERFAAEEAYRHARGGQ